jgi:hypothetical protein
MTGCSNPPILGISTVHLQVKIYSQREKEKEILLRILNRPKFAKRGDQFVEPEFEKEHL